MIWHIFCLVNFPFRVVNQCAIIWLIFPSPQISQDNFFSLCSECTSVEYMYTRGDDHIMFQLEHTIHFLCHDLLSFSEYSIVY